MRANVSPFSEAACSFEYCNDYLALGAVRHTARALAHYFPFLFFILHISTCTEVKRNSGKTDRSTFNVRFVVLATGADTGAGLEFSLE